MKEIEEEKIELFLVKGDISFIRLALVNLLEHSTEIINDKLEPSKHKLYAELTINEYTEILKKLEI